jgi:hypothetical protein
MIRKSRMVLLAAPGPLHTPPPSSSPPKTPFLSYSSTSPLLDPSPLTRHRPQLTLLQTTPTAGNQHTDYGQRLEDDHNTTYGRPLVHVRRQQRVSPQQCRPPTEARTVSHAVSRTAARRRRRSRLQHVGAREVLCAGEGCTSVVSNVGWEEDVYKLTGPKRHNTATLLKRTFDACQ